MSCKYNSVDASAFYFEFKNSEARFFTSELSRVRGILTFQVF